MSLDELQINYKDFMDKTTALYGASGSGKSAIIVDILYHLRLHIGQIIVFCPTDPVNHTYSGSDSGDDGIVAKPLIHYKLTEDLIIKIWKRQEMLAAVYSRANQQTVLESLFAKLQLGNVNKILDRADAQKAEHISKIEDQYLDKGIQKKKIAELEEKHVEFRTLLYKRYIMANISTLSRMNLSTDEAFSLKYIGFNPRMVVIFDDCSADFANIKSKDARNIFEKMFFQNRWVYLTVILAVHDDKLIDAELRKNAYISIFTTRQSAYSYVERKTNCFGRDTIKAIAKISEEVFIQGQHQKLAYIRQQDKFYRVTATYRKDTPFTFGADSIRHYCDAIKSSGLSMDRNNEFYDYFSS